LFAKTCQINGKESSPRGHGFGYSKRDVINGLFHLNGFGRQNKFAPVPCHRPANAYTAFSGFPENRILNWRD
jgi:hypothetical protein